MAIVIGALQLRQAAVLPGQGVLGVLRRGRRADDRRRRAGLGFPGRARSQSIELDGPRVLVKFNVDKNIRLGDRTEAAIKTKSLLGTKILEVTSRGDGQLSGTIPVDRTTSPYQLPDALGDLATTISGLNTNQLSDSLRVLAETFADTPPRAEDRRRGCGAVLADAQRARRTAARPAGQRQQGDRRCWPSAATRWSAWSATPMRCWPSCRSQSAALDQISGNISALSQQLKGFIAENRDTMQARAGQAQRRADDRRQPQGAGAEVDQAARRLRRCRWASRCRPGRSSRPTSPTCCPGQFVQPFIDAAFSDLGLDPNVLLPSQRTDPQTGQPGTPALPVPYPRTGQGGEPHLTLPDAITGNPGDQGCGPPGLPLPGPRLLPLPGAAAGAAARRPAAGTARRWRRPDWRPRRSRRRSPVCVPAPGEVPPSPQGEVRPMTPQTRHGLILAVASGADAGRRRRRAAADRPAPINRTNVIAYFDNSNGIYAGDDVRILGVPVGKIEKHRAAARSGSRSRSGSTASTRCPPTPRP